MKTYLASLVLFFALLSVVSVPSQAANERTGKWIRIKKVWELDSQRVAEFAVSEHNRLSGENLLYVKIYRGYIDGLYWKLFVQATDNGKARRYETLVKDVPETNSRALLYFKAST
ncbi:cysteine proteinase inhibitor 1-like [Wolffia australiana]